VVRTRRIERRRCGRTEAIGERFIGVGVDRAVTLAQ
jgi:hypothetical protein